MTKYLIECLDLLQRSKQYANWFEEEDVPFQMMRPRYNLDRLVKEKEVEVKNEGGKRLYKLITHKNEYRLTYLSRETKDFVIEKVKRSGFQSLMKYIDERFTMTVTIRCLQTQRSFYYEPK